MLMAVSDVSSFVCVPFCRIVVLSVAWIFRMTCVHVKTAPPRPLSASSRARSQKPLPAGWSRQLSFRLFVAVCFWRIVDLWLYRKSRIAFGKNVRGFVAVNRWSLATLIRSNFRDGRCHDVVVSFDLFRRFYFCRITLRSVVFLYVYFACISYFFRNAVTITNITSIIWTSSNHYLFICKLCSLCVTHIFNRSILIEHIETCSQFNRSFYYCTLSFALKGINK